MARSLVERTGLWLGVAGLVVFAAALSLWPERGVAGALAVGAKGALAVGLAVTALRVGRAVHGGSSTVGSGDMWQPVLAMAVVSVALALLFWRTPSRLTLNVVGYLSLGAPLAWVVARRAGGRTAVVAVAALGVLAMGTGAVDARRPPIIEDAHIESNIKWTVGWPNDRWALRHTIELEEPLVVASAELAVPLAREYRGGTRVLAALNGRELEPVTPRGTGFRIAVPAALLAGQRRLSFELRADPPDRDLRLMAFRWGRGATVPDGASEYFDGQRWFPGTFNDVTGAAQRGIYVVRLEYS